MKFQKISDNQAKQYGKTAAEVRQVGQQRIAMERAGVTGGPGKTVNTATDGGVRKVTMPKSPLVSKPPTGDAGKAAVATGAKTPNVGGLSSRPNNVPPPIPGRDKPSTASDSKTGTGPGSTGITGRSLPGKSDTGGATGGDKTTHTPPPVLPHDRDSKSSGSSKSPPPRSGSSSNKDKSSDKGKDKGKDKDK